MGYAASTAYATTAFSGRDPLDISD